MNECQACSSHFDKSVDSEDSEVRLALGVIHQIQIHQLLELQVVCLHAVHHIGKKSAGGFNVQKIMTFYLSFFENVVLRRSYIVICFKSMIPT